MIEPPRTWTSMPMQTLAAPPQPLIPSTEKLPRYEIANLRTRARLQRVRQGPLVLSRGRMRGLCATPRFLVERELQIAFYKAPRDEATLRAIQALSETQHGRKLSLDALHRVLTEQHAA